MVHHDLDRGVKAAAAVLPLTVLRARIWDCQGLMRQ